VKQLKELQTQVEKLRQELSSSKDKTQELEKMVSELQPYKEQAQVSKNSEAYYLFYIFAGNIFKVKKVLQCLIFTFYHHLKY